MFERLEDSVARYRELEQLLGLPETARQPGRLRELTSELAELRDSVRAYERWKELGAAIAENEELLDDAELAELAKEELVEQKVQQEELERELKRLLVPKDPNDAKDIVLEIRSGAGGDEAALFAADMFRLYVRYAERRGYKLELLSAAETDAGGYKEVVASLTGKGVYGRLKYESGVHRVQRVPETESQGRIHTSTITVAVMPEAQEVDVQIDEAKELRIDTFRSSGPGGQHVNTTDSAIRITHLPTGLAVSCQDEKSQHKNKARAMKILRARLYEQELERQQAERAAERRGKIGSGDRSERIRTYNFPQNRVTDHRVGLTLHKLEQVLDGDLDALIEAVQAHFEAEAIRSGEGPA
ncbi:MAG: peptide chain release factor 1 [Deltaproteobacteria bacterium]|nr:peptide chain release factor 1 [Deltaproteobacteria bacterium]MBW2413580.1 peptide chain release factor 1 [Deltaproteobacteria bacterium]